MATPVISQDLLAKLNAFFAQPGSGAEFFDEASNRAYIPQRGVFTTPDGKVHGSTGTINDSNVEGFAAPVTGFSAYDFAPGMYKDNAELNGKPYDILDASGTKIGSDVFRGMSAKWDMLNLAVPLIMMSAGFGATMAGAGAAAGAAPAAAEAGGIGTSIEALQAAEAAAALGEAGAVTAGAAPTGFGVVDTLAPGISMHNGATVFGLVDTSVLPAGWGLPGISAGAAGGAVAGSNGAFLGENVASGVPEWDLAATKAGLSLTTPAAPLPGVGGKSLLEVLSGNPLAGKLGQAALSALLTGALGSAASGGGGGGGGGATTAGGERTAMPEPVGMEARRAYDNSLLEQIARRGRSSTILTKTASGGLGG